MEDQTSLTAVVVGVALGLLIGAICGIVFLQIMRALDRAREKEAAETVQLTRRALGVTAAMAGSPLLVTISEAIPLKQFIVWYAIALAFVFLLLVARLGFRLAMSVGEDLGSQRG